LTHWPAHGIQLCPKTQKDKNCVRRENWRTNPGLLGGGGGKKHNGVEKCGGWEKVGKGTPNHVPIVQGGLHSKQIKKKKVPKKGGKQSTEGGVVKGIGHETKGRGGGSKFAGFERVMGRRKRNLV